MKNKSAELQLLWTFVNGLYSSIRDMYFVIQLSSYMRGFPCSKYDYVFDIWTVEQGFGVIVCHLMKIDLFVSLRS